MPVWVKREFGVSPKRTRHCNSERHADAIGETREGAWGDDLKPGDLLTSFENRGCGVQSLDNRAEMPRYWAAEGLLIFL